MRPEVETWDRSQPVLRRVRRRVLAADVLKGTAVGIAVGGLVAGLGRYLGWPSGTVLVAALVAGGSAAAVWLVGYRARRSAAAIAARIERRHTDFYNIVVTAVELSQHAERAQPSVRERVFADADALLSRIDDRREVPLAGPMTVCALALVAAVAVASGVHERAPRAVRAALDRAGRGTPARPSVGIAVTLEPPPYTRLPVQRLTNPERIDAMEGTRLLLEIDTALVQSVRFGNAVMRTRADGARATAALSLKESGYLAVESSQGLTLISVTVTPDRPPAIRVEQPGRDLLLSEPNRSVGVEALVTDDHGIADLSLRYTRVSGSGEQFEFREGELPLGVAERDRLMWRARATFALSRLGLEPGDSLVYHFVARDERAGDAGTSTSDTFFIEIAGPGQVGVEGLAMPPDRERYALSQQMIVLKIERLRQRAPGLARELLQQQAADIAGEQRAVKANFVFLMGGQVEDEEAEAEQSNEIQEGRLQNTARREIVRAIDHMTRTEQALATTDTSAALQQARLAVEALQRAFGRNRYILRTLAVRDRVDPSRRLTGNLEGARGYNRPETSSASESKTDRIRGLFTSAIAVAEDLSAGRPIESTLSSLSERALAIDPADAAWQRVAQHFATVRNRLAAGEQRGQVEERLREALRLIVVEGQRTSLAAPLISPRPAVRGAWADELDAARGSRQ